MYGLDINFLKDRPAYQPRGEQKKAGLKLPTGNLTPLYLGVGIGLCLPILAGGGLWFLQIKTSELEQAIALLDEQSKKLDVEIAGINKIKQESEAVKTETKSLVTVFDQIRPWSAMLEDLRDRIPTSVQIENVKQIAATPPTAGEPPSNPAGGIEITGLARSFNDVNDFLLVLQKSPFLKSSDSKITTASLVDAPLSASGAANRVQVKPPQVVKYTIQSSLSDVPASELMRELEQKGTIGLVARIRALQQTGVITR